MISCITSWVGIQLVSISQVEEVLLSKVRNTLPAGLWSIYKNWVLSGGIREPSGSPYAKAESNR